MRFSTFCNGKAHAINILGVWIAVSYETPIAASYNGECKRVSNSWGPTTGKHFNQLGCKHYPEVEEGELHNFIHSSLAEASLQLIRDKMEANHA